MYLFFGMFIFIDFIRIGMTIAVSCLLPDGVILGVDSAVTVNTSDGKGIAKVYENAEKLFQLGDKPIGIAIYGIGNLGTRSIGSYIREFEVRTYHKILNKEYQLKDVVEAMRKFFMDSYQENIIKQFELNGIKFEELSIENRPSLGLIVGGFSSKAYVPEVWKIEIPIHDTSNSSVKVSEDGNFGTSWYALFEPIHRYMNGFSPSFLQEILDYFALQRKSPITSKEVQEITAIAKKYQYSIPYFAMSIQEGIAHTRFLVELVINHYRFATGASLVGGKARIGKVSYKGEKFEILD